MPRAGPLPPSLPSLSITRSACLPACRCLTLLLCVWVCVALSLSLSLLPSSAHLSPLVRPSSSDAAPAVGCLCVCAVKEECTGPTQFAASLKSARRRRGDDGGGASSTLVFDKISTPATPNDEPVHPCPVCLCNEEDQEEGNQKPHGMCYGCGQTFCCDCRILLNETQHKCPMCRTTWLATRCACVIMSEAPPPPPVAVARGTCRQDHGVAATRLNRAPACRHSREHTRLPAALPPPV